MDLSLTPFRARGLRVAETFTLLAFVAIYAAHSHPVAQETLLLLMIAGCVVTAVIGVGWAVRVPDRRVVALLAAVSALGVAASMAYLRSLDPNGADIPLAGGGILLISLGGLLGTCIAASE